MNSSRKTRNPWPLAIVVYFIVFITFIVTFTVFAARQKVDLVSPDYYEAEIRFQKQIERLSRTQPLNTRVAVTYDAGRQQVSIRLPSGPSSRPGSGLIGFYRPSDARIDRSVPLAVNDEGAQVVDVKQLRDGLWKVRVQWTLNGQEYFFDQPVVVLSHQPRPTAGLKSE